MDTKNSLYPIPHTLYPKYPGFTLTEMIVAVSLMVVLIMAVGQIFKNTGKAISLAQASADVTSRVRGTQMQMESDLAGLDRNGFLTVASSSIAFTTMGNFTNYTSTADFSHNTPANAAVIAYGVVGTPGILGRQVTALCTGGSPSPGTLGQLYSSFPGSYGSFTIGTLPTNVWSAATPVAGYFQMMPIMLQNVSNFSVAWTDGTMTPTTGGPLNWYTTSQTFSKGGTYPKAISFTYTVTDSNNVLQGGRTYVHIVKVPD